MCTPENNKFYYIMDYNGNYYRVDSENQLIAASDETDAAVFNFDEANKRIGTGTKSKFYFMAPVNTELDAETLCRETADDESQYDIDGTSSVVRDLTEAEISEAVEKSMSEYDLSRLDWKEYITHFIYIASGLKEYKEGLLKEESDVDKKICDVLHYIELCDTNDKEAADLVELLRVCRENRRDIKDEILRVENFQRNLGTNVNIAKAKETLKAVNGLETRKYIPRKFVELFEGSELKARAHVDKKLNNRALTSEITDEYTEYTEEELQMEYVRRETVFDGKDNDWMEFAIRQAEFYKNANQYIVNIRLDIDDIDKEIEKLMEEIEVSNCNVTQGYKLFKRLKELRLEHRQKEKELQCLYILTEYFEVEAMADACESNADALEKFLFGEKEDTAVEAAVDENEVENEDNDSESEQTLTDVAI
ncbi:MAG: hypothetical protein ACI4LO_09100 [Anaerovoracaceae bacterium]